MLNSVQFMTKINISTNSFNSLFPIVCMKMELYQGGQSGYTPLL